MYEFSRSAPADRPSLFRILLADFPAVTLVYALLIVWLISAAWLHAGELSAEIAGVVGFLTLLMVSAIVYRVAIAWKILAHGAEAQGSVAWIERGRRSARIDFVYTYEGEDFNGFNRLGFLTWNRFQVEQPITLMVDPRNPQRALIRDLYL